MLSIFVFCLTVSYVYSESVQWILTTSDKSKAFQRQPDISVVNGTSDLAQLFTIDTSTQYQNIYGYGAALTQSAAYLLTEYKQKDSTAYWKLLNQLFNQSVNNNESIAINILRYPMGASDFILPSINYFSYDDTYWDFSLSKLSLKNAENYQIPILKDILTINPSIKVLLAPWSAPTWLKTSSQQPYPKDWESGSFNDTGNNMEVYANYFVKTLNLYKSEHNIEFFAISMQNEPLNCPNSWTVMCMSPQTQIKFINMLAPLIKSNVNYNVKIMIYDHNWDNTNYAITVLSDKTAYSYADFTAWHCYGGSVSAQSVVHDQFPDKEMIFTECSGTGKDNFAGNLKWNAENIWTGSIDNWSGLVTHWNLVLDQNYNPHNGGCGTCRGTFQFDTNNNFALTYYEEYFGIGQYGKWIDPEYPAKRVKSTMKGQSCATGVVFKNSDQAQLKDKVIVVVNNFCSNSIQIGVQQQSMYFEATVPVGISSFLW